MPRGRKITLAAALAAGVAVYAAPAPIAPTLRAESRPPRTAEAAIPVPIPPPPEEAPEAAAALADAEDPALAAAPGSAESEAAEAAADPLQLADAAPFAGEARATPPDGDWRITVTVGEADRCTMTAGDDCAPLAIRYRAWDFSIELGSSGGIEVNARNNLAFT